MAGVYVITPTDGLELPDTAVRLDRLRRFAEVDIYASNERYRAPLVRHAQRLARALGPHGKVVLLGTIATGKYILPLQEVLGPRLYFPSEFVGRGDMSRGSLLLRHARAQLELDYVRFPEREAPAERSTAPGPSFRSSRLRIAETNAPVIVIVRGNPASVLTAHRSHMLLRHGRDSHETGRNRHGTTKGSTQIQPEREPRRGENHAQAEARHAAEREGRKGGQVKSRKQAIAIGLSEARKKGKKVPRKRS